MTSEPVRGDYAATLEDLKRHVRTARLKVQRAANSELLQLWWQIGRTILDRQAEQGWGSRVIERLAADLRAEFPSMRGFSRRNLLYMRAFAEAWPDSVAIVQRPIARLPWGHVIELLDKLETTVDQIPAAVDISPRQLLPIFRREGRRCARRPDDLRRTCAGRSRYEHQDDAPVGCNARVVRLDRGEH